MEAVPRLPMLYFDLKISAEAPNYGPKLKQYIKDFYHEDPDSYTNEIHELESLRGAAVRPSKDVDGVNTLKRYYCQLHFLMSRFPMVKDGAASVLFSWRDIYANVKISVADIRFEIVSILYNIGALHTQLGICDNRTTENGMKMACTHFQCAAWAFQHLRDTFPQSAESDLAPDIMQFAYHMCLAQAQECILEKSMMDNRKASIIVKVAVQVVNYYAQACSALKQSVSEESVGSRVYAAWRRLAKFKEAYHRCVIQLYQGVQAEEQQKMGERVAFYQLARETLEEAMKIAKYFEKSEVNLENVQEALSFTMDIVEGKRKAAKNENEFIYHDEVPDRDQLPKALGVSLVKGIPFSVNDLEVSGADIFGRLVPMRAHEASSLYSEEKAKLLRNIGGMVEEKDQILVDFLSSLQLDYLNCYSEANELPQDLIDRCAALTAKPDAIRNLIDSMAKLSDVCVEVENMLQEIKALLEEEDALEKSYQEVMGARPPSIVATDMTRESAKYQEAHEKASESNQALHKVMTTHISNLKILSLPLTQLHQQIPPPPKLTDPESESIVKEMQTLMNKVREMRNQRVMLLVQLRESICKDDITQLLVTKQNGNMDGIFEQELKKHSDVTKLIQQNLAAQDNILKAVTDAYARYGTVRKWTAEAVRRRQNVINALISCFDAYEDLLDKSEKGHEFYNKLQTNVSKLLVRVKSTIKVQQEERELMLAKNSSAGSKKSPEKETEKKVNDFTKSSNTPKLKDYLNKDGGLNTSALGSSYPTANSVAGNLTYTPPSAGVYSPQQSGNYFDTAGNMFTNMANLSIDSKTQSWVPGVRPAPVGSEATSSAGKLESGQDKTVPSFSYAPSSVPASSFQSSASSCSSTQYQQPYGYSASWGYSSLPSAMSSYISPNIQYPSDFTLPTDSKSDQQNNALLAQQGYRHDPAGAPAYQYSSGYNSQQVSSTSNPAYNSSSSAYHQTDGTAQQSITPAGYFQQNAANYHQNMTSNTASYQSAAVDAQANSYLNPPTTAYNTPTAAYNNSAAASSDYQNPSQTSGLQSYYSNPNPISSTPYHNEMNYYASSYPQQQQANWQQTPVTTAPSNVGYSEANQYMYNSNSASFQTASTGSFQYMTNQNMSYYSNAGNYPTNQTSSSYSSMTPSSAYQPEVSTAQIPPNYYQMPCYGYQYANSNGSSVIPDVSTTVVSPTSQAQPQPQHSTYMQARMNSNPSTTYSPQSSRSSSSEATSNIDLLAGLDFTISQQPLIPLQEKSSSSSVSAASSTTVVSASQEALDQKTETQSRPTEEKEINSNSDQLRILQIPVDQNKVQILKSPAKDPFDDAESLAQFTQEVEKYEKFVEGLTTKTLNGPTPLDLKWKELQDLQEKDNYKRSISVARCYPMKNRYADILPYDCSRVELPSTKDDYINASFMKPLTPFSPFFILTQAPLPSTYADFWTMAYEQQVEVIVCLLSDLELEGQIYWPLERGKEVSMGRMRLSLQSINTRQHWIERTISIFDAESRISRVVIHLQFISWPGSSFPASPGPFLSYVTESLAFHSQQRILTHPVVVHCLSGVGRTGLYCLTAVAICEVQAGHGLVDLIKFAALMSESRKGALRDREHLKFAYQALLYFAQDLLMKRGILTSGSRFEDKHARSEGKCHTRHPSQDFLLGPPAGLSQLQSGIEKLGLEPENQSHEIKDFALTNEVDQINELVPSTASSITDDALGETASSSSIISSGQSTPLMGMSLHLTDLSKLKETMSKKSHSRFAPESFRTNAVTLESPKSTADDPFSKIDPLWPLKRS